MRSQRASHKAVASSRSGKGRSNSSAITACEMDKENTVNAANIAAARGSGVKSHPVPRKAGGSSAVPAPVHGGPRQRHSSADLNSNSSSVSTSTREKAVDHFLLHCDESPMGALRSHALPAHEEDPATTTTTTTTTTQKTAAQKRVELEQILALGKIELETREDKRDLFHRMKATDEETRPDPDYLDRHSGKQLPQEYLNSNMRTICCGWMVELSLEFSFQQETLMLAIRIFDRSVRSPSPPSFQSPRSPRSPSPLSLFRRMTLEDQDFVESRVQIMKKNGNCFERE